MKKILLFSVAVLLMISPLLAKDKSAVDILKELKSVYESYDSICADFTQVFVWKLTEEEHTMNGKICVQKGVKFKIETPDNMIVNDGKTLWTLNYGNKQILVNDGSKDSNQNPFLKDFIDKFLTDYKAELVSEDNSAYQLKLAANDEDQFLLEIHLSVDKKSKFLCEIKQLDANENETTYKISNLNTNITLSADDFKIKDMDKYEVVDLR